MEAIAAQVQAEKIFGRVNVVVDAQRGEFYLATWEISETARTEISPLKIGTAGEIDSRQRAGEIFVGPEMGRTLFPAAAMVAWLAANRNDSIADADGYLEPIYLREINFVKAPTARNLV